MSAATVPVPEHSSAATPIVIAVAMSQPLRRRQGFIEGPPAIIDDAKCQSGTENMKAGILAMSTRAVATTLCPGRLVTWPCRTTACRSGCRAWRRHSEASRRFRRNRRHAPARAR
jgi:hypothetical protein